MPQIGIKPLQGVKEIVQNYENLMTSWTYVILPYNDMEGVRSFLTLIHAG